MVCWVFFGLRLGLINKYVSIWPQIPKSNINSFANLNDYLITSETGPRARYVCSYTIHWPNIWRVKKIVYFHIEFSYNVIFQYQHT
jgi:hypothetical protein